MAKIQRESASAVVGIGQDLVCAREAAEISPLKLGEMLGKVAEQSNYVASDILVRAVLEESTVTNSED